jgi:hypothetical protein
LLQAAFPQGLPPGLVGGVDLALAEPLLSEFKLGVVVPLGRGGIRLAISDQGDPVAWQAWLVANWGVEVARFLDSGPTGCRKMVDTDGVTATIYLDDLQDHGCQEMCRILELPGGRRSHFTRHSSLPEVLLPRELRPVAAVLTGGIWGLRWCEDRCVGALWISESRWREDPGRTADLVERELSPPPIWARCRDALAPLGWRLYPDAIELGPRGQVDVTMGWVRFDRD